MTVEMKSKFRMMGRVLVYLMVLNLGLAAINAIDMYANPGGWWIPLVAVILCLGASTFMACSIVSNNRYIRKAEAFDAAISVADDVTLDIPIRQTYLDQAEAILRDL